MGSGELAPALVGTHRAGIAAAAADRVIILDTPFGFQENAPQLTERLVDFFETSLNTGADVVSLRYRNFDEVQKEKLLSVVRRARYVFAGPGSPSYALEIWQRAGIVDAFKAMVEAGGTLTFASAASLTLGRRAIPVYEMYKVGQDPFWLEGLDLMSRLGLPCVVVPHWNNAEGGNHDTSRCYIGQRRLGMLEEDLDVGVLGVDEHTAAIVDFGAGTLAVTGRGTVTVRGEKEIVLESGSTTELREVGDILSGYKQATRSPEKSVAAGSTAGLEAMLTDLLRSEELSRGDVTVRQEFRSKLVEVAELAQAGLQDPRDSVGGFIELLLDVRSSARSRGDYETADDIRLGLAQLGVEVRDTRDGHLWVLDTDE
jgi:cyanophycinase-like exopeptidase